jgi:DNA mismatch repair protein MutL
MIRIEGGKVAFEKPVGTAEGTTVIVSDLFYNTPARLKFMKADRAESASVIDLVSKLSLGRADLKVRLVSNDAILFSTPGRGDLMATILTIYGRNLGSGLLPLRAENGDFSLSGYVSSPAAARAAAGRKGRVFFINGRSVRSKLMEKALAEGYAETPAEGGRPVAFLFLRVPPERLDVNIHPAKNEVRFDDEPALSAFVTEAVRAAVRTKEAIPTIAPRGSRFVLPDSEYGATAPAKQLAFAGAAREPGGEGRAAGFGTGRDELVDIKYLLSTKREESDANRENLFMEEAEEARFHAEDRAPGPFDIAAITPMGRLFSTYILGRDADSFYFIDQHAAHERVLYERFLRQYRSREKLCQQLLAPLVIELPHVARALGKDDTETRAFLAAMGYEAEDFGANAYKINAVPAFLSLSEAENFLNRLLAELPQDRPPENRAAVERVISAACKAAVKSGDSLGDAETFGLLSDLAACENPYACPHGRPVFIRLTKRGIEKLFNRR